MALIGTTQLTRGVNKTTGGFFPIEGEDTFFLGSWVNDYEPFRLENGFFSTSVSQTFQDTTFFGTQSEFETSGTFVDYYLKINEEVMRILIHSDQTQYTANENTGNPLIRIKVERGFGGTPEQSHATNDFVQIHNSLDSIQFEVTEDVPLSNQPVPYDVIEYTLDDGFVSESISPGFGVDNVTIEQTIIKPFDPFSGMNIQTSSFQNTKQTLEDSNQDGRIELGMFAFDEENIASDNFPSILTTPFLPILKENLVKNGDCKFIERSYIEENDVPVVVKPEGEWRFLSLQDITDINLLQFYDFPDFQGFQGYGGRYAYAPMSLEQSGSAGINYWGGIQEYDGSNYPYTFKQYFGGFDQNLLSTSYVQQNPFSDIRSRYNLRYIGDYDDTGMAGRVDVPTIAAWIVTNDAYSNQRCLCFQNYYLWDNTTVHSFLRNVDIDNFRKWPFNWLMESSFQNDGQIIDDSYTEDNVIPENQYRVLNQVQKIYDKFNDTQINPYSSLKIRLKMKTTSVFPPTNGVASEFYTNPMSEDLGYAPQVEVGIISSQFEETPKSGRFSLPSNLNEEGRFRSPGSFNSTRYFNGANFEQKKDSALGGMTRFRNKNFNQWETFEFDFNLKNDHNNRGLIYGVPYGGSFDDLYNGGPVEIMINHNAKGGSGDTQGIPQANPGEIYFKVPGYDNSLPPQQGGTTKTYFGMRSPHQSYNGTPIQVLVRHGAIGTDDYMTVPSKLGDPAGTGVNTSTGVQNDGTVLEAYLMYVGCNNYNSHPDTHFNLPMRDEIDFTYPDVIVAYWNGERWTYDNNAGYDKFRTFAPINTHCFIIGRLYRSPISTEDGITGIDQYISNQSQFPTDGLGNMFLFLQAGNNFNGRVLIDNIECFESYKFKLDCDVRKKISVGNYGIADLTKYYDKELQPNEYKDSTAPLEVQFYFYPQYPTNEFFDIERTPIYQDFRLGRFYIYDIDWGDGSPNEFTSTPEKIDENTALYHTYENHGIFEITGTALRIKNDEEGNILGVVHNQNFKLRININEGLDEDFLYFGSDGFSFLPFRNTTPIIGGISDQSSYYKTIKRQLGFLDDEKISIDFKNKSDKLKTELALFKIENQNQANLEVLPAYLQQRVDENGDVIYNGIAPIKEELGKGIGDCDLTSIKYYTEPKSIWEMFGFEESDLNVIANPTEIRYWKNIIPQDYSIFNRDGVNINIEDNEKFVIDTYSEQNYLNDLYYYPVLPKHGADGRFVEINTNTDGDIVSGYPRINNVFKIPFPLQGEITNEMEQNENLLFNIINQKIDVEVFDDNSGNKNYGISIGDFKSKFEKQTLRVQKSKIKNIFKTSRVNGAF